MALPPVFRRGLRTSQLASTQIPWAALALGMGAVILGFILYGTLNKSGILNIPLGHFVLFQGLAIFFCALSWLSSRWSRKNDLSLEDEDLPW